MDVNPYAPPSVPTVDPQRTLLVRCEITEPFLLDMHERDMLRNLTWPTVLHLLFSLVAIGVGIAIVVLSIAGTLLVDRATGGYLVPFGIPAACVMSILSIAVMGRLTKSVWRKHAARRLKKSRERIASYVPGTWTLVIAEAELTVQFPSGDSRQYPWGELMGDYSEAVFKGILLKSKSGDLIPVPSAMECEEPWESVARMIRKRNWKWFSLR